MLRHFAQKKKITKKAEFSIIENMPKLKMFE